jgi:hypothetical protein
MPFQTSALVDPSPGLEGGWASVNPHTSMLNPNNGDPTISAYSSWKAGTGGVIVGRFAFADLTTGLVTSAHPGTSNVRVGFVHRYHPVIIPGYLGQNYSGLYAGQEVDIADGGDFWVRIAAGSAAGPKLFASYVDGSAIPGVSGTPPTATGVTATTTSGSPNLTVVAGGTLLPGQPISGTGIPAGAYIVSATGATAVMSANASASGSGVAITQTTAFETRWYVDSLAPAGGLSKISTRG